MFNFYKHYFCTLSASDLAFIPICVSIISLLFLFWLTKFNALVDRPCDCILPTKLHSWWIPLPLTRRNIKDVQSVRKPGRCDPLSFRRWRTRCSLFSIGHIRRWCGRDWDGNRNFTWFIPMHPCFCQCCSDLLLSRTYTAKQVALWPRCALSIFKHDVADVLNFYSGKDRFLDERVLYSALRILRDRGPYSRPIFKFREELWDHPQSRGCRTDYWAQQNREELLGGVKIRYKFWWWRRDRLRSADVAETA